MARGKGGGGGSAGLSAAAQKAYVDTLTDTLGPQTKSHTATRLEDVVIKNEVLIYFNNRGILLIIYYFKVVLVENRRLQAEVRRLNVENSDLLRRVRFSDSNAHYMKNQVHIHTHTTVWFVVSILIYYYCDMI